MAVDIIDKFRKGLTTHCMNGVWKKLLPEIVEGTNKHTDTVLTTTQEIVNLAQRIGFYDVDQEGLLELLEAQDEEDLTNEDLLTMEEENYVEMSEENEEPECAKALTPKGMSEALGYR